MQKVGTIVCFLMLASSPAHAQERPSRGAIITNEEAIESVENVPTKQTVEVAEEQLQEARQVQPFVVSDVVLECDLPRCERPSFKDALRDIIAIRPGDRVDGSLIARAIRRLTRSQFFSRIEFSVQGQELHWILHGATVIRDVKVKAGIALNSKIERRISFRSGGVWQEDSNVIELQRRSIREYFQRDGFYGTTVDIEVTRVSEFVVDLEINIDRGKRLSVRRVYMKGHKAFTYEEVFEELMSQFSLLRGYTSSAFSDAAEEVIHHYRQAGFLEARLLSTEEDIKVDEGVVDLYLELDEGERWDVLINGNRRFNRDKILDKSGLLRAGFVDRTELNAAEQRIEELYETRGYFFARVEIEQHDVDGGNQSLSININEGNIAEIQEIRFRGNTAIRDQELRALMTTSEYDLVTRGGYLQRARLDSEIEAIEKAYAKKGYPWARVERTVFLAENDGRELYVTLFIYEGPQVMVSDISIASGSGNTAGGKSTEYDVVSSKITEDLNMRVGTAFQRHKLAKDKAKVEEYWEGKTEGTVRVQSTCRWRGEAMEQCNIGPPTHACTRSLVEERTEACTRRTVAGRTVEECVLTKNEVGCDVPQSPPRVSIRYEIEKHQESRFGHILVRGAFDTRDWVIVSELPFRGEQCKPDKRRVNLRKSGFEPPESCVFDRDILLQGQSNIRSIGLFESVRMEVIGPDQDTNVVTVIISVEETTTRFVEYRIGLNSRPTGENNSQFRTTNTLSYRDINVLGRGEELRLVGAFDFAIGGGRRVRDGEFDAELRAIYFDPRFYLFGALKKPWEARLELAYDYELLPIAPAPQTKTISLEGVLRDSIRKFRGVFFEFGVNLRRTLTRDQSENAVTDGFVPSFILSIRPRVTIERRDNPLNPSKGYFGEITLEIADDFLGFLDSERFTTVSTRHSGYIPVGPFVLALNAQIGLGFGGILNGFKRQGELSLPLSERFFLGGVNSVRGLATNTMDSQGTDEAGGDVYFNANVELRYQLIPSANLYGAVFFDAGQLAADIGDLRWSSTVVSGGIGLRWLVADIVPIVLDYGVILNRSIGEDFGRLHFNIGYSF